MRNGLSVNPLKTVLVPFTKRRKQELARPLLGNQTLDFHEQVKYLGVILDCKLTFAPHVQKVIAKATNSCMACRNIIIILGRRFGLRPNMVLWIYTAVIRPMILYAALVWWPRTLQVTTQASLRKLQRLTCMYCCDRCHEKHSHSRYGSHALFATTAQSGDVSWLQTVKGRATPARELARSSQNL